MTLPNQLSGLPVQLSPAGVSDLGLWLGPSQLWFVCLHEGGDGWLCPIDSAWEFVSLGRSWLPWPQLPWLTLVSTRNNMDNIGKRFPVRDCLCCVAYERSEGDCLNYRNTGRSHPWSAAPCPRRSPDRTSGEDQLQKSKQASTRHIHFPLLWLCMRGD